MKIGIDRDYALFFDHLSQDEMIDTMNRINFDQSIPLTFFENNEKRFCVIFDIEKESIHVRHIGGNFAWRWKFIENAATILCTLTGKQKITVWAQENFMKYAVNRLGFLKNEKPHEFEKVVL